MLTSSSSKIKYRMRSICNILLLSPIVTSHAFLLQQRQPLSSFHPHVVSSQTWRLSHISELKVRINTSLRATPSDRRSNAIAATSSSAGNSSTATSTISESSRKNGNSKLKSNPRNKNKRTSKPQQPDHYSKIQERRRLNNDSRALEREIVQLGRRGKTNEALVLYRSTWDNFSRNNSKQKATTPRTTIRPTTRLMNSAIDACARARPPRISTAFEIFNEGISKEKSLSTSLTPNVFTFGSLMSACARSRNADAAIELLDSMEKEYKVKPNAIVYSTAMSACERAIPAQPHTALRLLKECVNRENMDISVVGYNTVISALARGGDWKTAVCILKEMEGGGDLDYVLEEEVLGGGKHPEPDEVTYGTVMSACERAKEWHEVLRYADAMQERGFQLDGISLSSALHACSTLGLADQAMAYLEQMKNLKNNGLNGVQQRRTRGRQRSGAKQALQGPDEVAYGMAISACSRAGRWTDGLKLLEEIKQLDDGYLLNKSVMAYTAAIDGCAEVGQWTIAFQILEEMIQSNVTPNVLTYSAVISSCAAASASSEDPQDKIPPMKAALQLFSRMKENGVQPNVVTYNAAIKACAEGLNVKYAFRLMQELQHNSNKTKPGENKLEPTMVTFGTLMTACERVGDVESAGKVFNLMKECGWEPNEVVYGAAISCCRKAGETDKTFRLLKKMIKDGLFPNAATFNTAIFALAEGKQLENALRVFKLMQAKRYSTRKPNWQTFNILIRAFADDKQPENAELLLKMMRANDYEPDVALYTSTISAYEKTGQPMKALGLMERMNEDGYDFYDVKVVNEAFKRVVKLVNKVGKGLGTKDNNDEEES